MIYIHLNPLRAGIVQDLSGLEKYPYCGHGDLSGKAKYEWQDADYVLRYFCDRKRKPGNGIWSMLKRGWPVEGVPIWWVVV